MSKKELKQTIENITQLKADITRRLDRLIYLEKINEDKYSYMMVHIRANIKLQKRNERYLKALKNIISAFAKIDQQTITSANLIDLQNAISIAESEVKNEQP